MPAWKKSQERRVGLLHVDANSGDCLILQQIAKYGGPKNGYQALDEARL